MRNFKHVSHTSTTFPNSRNVWKRENRWKKLENEINSNKECPEVKFFLSSGAATVEHKIIPKKQQQIRNSITKSKRKEVNSSHIERTTKNAAHKNQIPFTHAVVRSPSPAYSSLSINNNNYSSTKLTPVHNLRVRRPHHVHRVAVIPKRGWSSPRVHAVSAQIQ